MKFIGQRETMTKQKPSQIQADLGGEFRNKDIQQAYESKGIILKETILHHSETNAVIERAIRAITTIARTTLIASGLPKNLWADAMKFTPYTKNRIPHKALGGKSPLEILQPVTDIIHICRGYCICISLHLILIYLQARVFQHPLLLGHPIHPTHISHSFYEWYEMLGRIMAKAGLQRCIANEGVFIPTPNTTLPLSSE
jgi:hypothetical protein